VTHISPQRLLKDVEDIIMGEIRPLDIYQIPTTEQRLINRIKNELVDSRLYIRDYESSDTRAAQQVISAKLQPVLNRLIANILKLSEYNILSAVDVAQISAQLSLIMENTL
jgi:hypothetical protein